MEESFPLTVIDPQPAAGNYMDCTESNGEEEDEEEDETKEGKGDAEPMKEEEETEEKKMEVEEEGRSEPPKWDDFFTAEALPDSQNSHNSQSCGSAPSPAPFLSPSTSRMTGSQTPELFSDDDDDSANNEHFTLTLSTSTSNQSSQNQETTLADTLILRDGLPDSQTSSDFDIPCTPESKAPPQDELSQLYRKLAAGEEVVIRKRD